jgi:glucan phosphoethanolaminetransferase (alkaline phosphatase superfamily)
MNLHWVRASSFPSTQLTATLSGALTGPQNRTSPVSLHSKTRRPKALETAWTAANCALVALPIGAILLHVYGPDIRASVTVGMRAAIVSKLVTVFEQAIYTVLSCIVVCALSVLRGFHKRCGYGFLLWPALAILCLSMLLDNKMGTVGADSLTEILSTNLREAAAYVLQTLSTINISGKQLAVALSPAAFYGFLALLGRVSGLRPKLTCLVFSLAVSAGALVVLFSRETLYMVSAYRDTQVIQQRLIQATRTELNHFTRQRSGPRLVVYIGESTNRELYRALNARIETRSFKDNVVLFEQVISPHSHTTSSLLRDLSISDDPFLDQLTYDTELFRPNLLSILNHEGVSTEWYSNQASDEWTARLFGSQAGRQYFRPQARRSSFTGYHKPDSEWLPRLLHAVHASQPATLFFHSYAGHFPYCENLPAGSPTVPPDIRTTLPFTAAFGDLPIFNRQRHREDINCYDRALDYIAANLDSVMQEMWTVAEPMVLVYFSDHGEDVLDGTGHESGSPSYRKIEVPLVVFFNAAARNQYEREFEAARANRDTRYSLAWISDSLVDISGLVYKRNLLSIFHRLDQTPDRYSSLRVYHGQRSVIAVDGDREARGIAALTKIDLYDKRRLIHSLSGELQNRICAHRADSWMKFNEALQVFPCIELDLVLDTSAQQVYVFHPPKANNYLTLKDLISHQSASRSKLWLDTKNLDKSNADFYLQYLNQLFAPANRSGILIETSLGTYDDTLLRSVLATFRNSGYGLSYYLPTEDGIRCSQSPAAHGCAEFTDHVVAIISSLPYNSLSFDVRAKRCAKAIQSQRNIQLNTWDADLRQVDKIDFELLREVNMYLLPYHTRFDY